MENTEKKETCDEFDKKDHPNEYMFLVQKLKSISKSIDLLEKKFLNKKT